MISPPPILVENRANGIRFIRFDAESTATSPVPPIFAIQRPAVIADSMKLKPTSLPAKPAPNIDAMTTVKHSITYVGVIAAITVPRSVYTIPIPSRITAVKAFKINLNQV